MIVAIVFAVVATLIVVVVVIMVANTHQKNITGLMPTFVMNPIWFEMFNSHF